MRAHLRILKTLGTLIVQTTPRPPDEQMGIPGLVRELLGAKHLLNYGIPRNYDGFIVADLVRAPAPTTYSNEQSKVAA